MPIEFRVIDGSMVRKPAKHPIVYLAYDNWDDFSYKTTFYATVIFPSGVDKEIGSVKIAYVSQPKGRTKERLDPVFTELDGNWFSLGQDIDYYKNLKGLGNDFDANDFLKSIGDVAFDDARLQLALDESVFSTSLTRSVSMSAILGQYRRVIGGQVPLTDFRFQFIDAGNPVTAPIDLSFVVRANSSPPTNVHVLIGRNGVGKTTLLNKMIGAVLNVGSVSSQSSAYFLAEDQWGQIQPITDTFFSSLVSMSFSAFDPFTPPRDQPDRSKGTAYFYIGLKKIRQGESEVGNFPPKSDKELKEDLVLGLSYCLSQPEKRSRWLSAIARLQSDENFAEMELERLANMPLDGALVLARKLAWRMSSGHVIVLLSITKLVELVEEKTLVLMDEPECHLHPPLLSAFMRALSDLLHSRNGVAIVATHSPVVVQEVPKNCVKKLARLGNQGQVAAPDRETFGENVGVLTHDIFGLEVTQSGFHELLRVAVENGGSVDEILSSFGFQMGHEGRAILLSMVSARDQAKDKP